MTDAHEPEFLVVALDHALEDLADSGDVVLLLRLWLQGAELARDEWVRERPVRHLDGSSPAQDAGLVERLARRGVLLPVGVTRPWVGRHDDSGLGTAHAGSPRVARLDEAPVLPLERVLAQVP